MSFMPSFDLGVPLLMKVKQNHDALHPLARSHCAKGWTYIPRADTIGKLRHGRCQCFLQRKNKKLELLNRANYQTNYWAIMPSLAQMLQLSSWLWSDAIDARAYRSNEIKGNNQKDRSRTPAGAAGLRVASDRDGGGAPATKGWGFRGFDDGTEEFTLTRSME